MRILKSDPKSAGMAAEILTKDAIAIIPTDTIYGFSGAVGKTAGAITRIKGRAPEKPFIALIAEPSDIYRYTDILLPPYVMQLWPAPLTVIVPLKTGGTQAFRCPADEWLRNVINIAGTAIYSTSVNRAGMPPLTDIEAICTEFETAVSLIVDAGQLHGTPSTIVDLCETQPRILRQGSVRLPV